MPTAKQIACAAICVALLCACSSAGAPELTSGLPAPGQPNAQQTSGQAIAEKPGADKSGAEQPNAGNSVTGDAAGIAGQSGLKLPELPSMAALTGGPLPVGSPTEVYTRVARGALTCWFGASGPLKGPYIYHAEAAPPSKGGRAEIDIRTRDVTASDPRSLKAFRVGIEAGGEGTQVNIENAKMPEPLATRLQSDVRRWAAGIEGCGEAPTTAGWAAAPAEPAKGPAKASKDKGSAKPANAKTTPVKDDKPR